MKKVISIFVALMLLVLAIVPVCAANNVMFSASDCEVFAGDEFTVDIFISDNSMLSSATLLVQYNDKQLQFANLDVGYIVEAGEKAIKYKNVKGNSGNSYVKIEYTDYSATLTSAGKFLTLTFIAKDNAAGRADIKLVADGGKFSSANGTFTPTFKNGKVNIINNETVTGITRPPYLTTTTDPASESSESESESSEILSQSQGSTVTQKATSTTVSNTNVDDENVKENTSDTDKMLIGVAVITVFAVIIVVITSNNDQNKNTGKKKTRKKKSSTKRKRK